MFVVGWTLFSSFIDYSFRWFLLFCVFDRFLCCFVLFCCCTWVRFVLLCFFLFWLLLFFSLCCCLFFVLFVISCLCVCECFFCFSYCFFLICTSPEMAWGTHLARNGLGRRSGSLIPVSCSGLGLSPRSVPFRRYVPVPFVLPFWPWSWPLSCPACSGCSVPRVLVRLRSFRLFWYPSWP